MDEPVQSESGSFFDFSERAKFVVRGPDALRFLNGQITNDLQKATATHAIEACILNAKGKINAHVFVSAAANAYFLDAETELRQALPARLDRYIIADAVEVEDVSDQFGLFHVLDSPPPILPNEWKVIQADRFTTAGWDVWMKQSEVESARQFFASQLPICDAECAETFRIESGIPRWGRELTAEIIPIEANLEKRCIDYSKGCYIGQEVVSRMKMSGQTNKRLCGLLPLGDEPLLAGMRLTSLEENPRDVGWVTSVGHSPRLKKVIALGFVKRGFNARGTKLRSLLRGADDNSTAVRVEVAALPFISHG